VSTDLIIIVPSRGRPEKIVELIEALKQTQTEALLWVAVDDDDPTRNHYKAVLERRDNVTMDVVEPSPNGGMVQALNALAVPLANASDPPFALGFMGDDHRPRTMHWDQAYVRALRKLGTGIVYGNDLLQGRNLPTQVAMTSDIVRTLGYMAPPTLRHLYVDNFWLQLGRELGRLTYLADVVVEHVHPGAKKADWDDGYERVNAPEMWDADKKASRRYRATQFAQDIVKLQPLLRKARR
jgi:glycosyltransferase involved in cell wall biosynthesis